MQTASDLIFIGATMDNYFRAFNGANGDKLWEVELPFSANSIPMSYEVNGKQYVVVAAGGHAAFGATAGDALIAFALPE